ncbi:hypothetical protein G6F40_017558 [Rhizopus arrhizus]|nr:hypothetical protein G6F40_017558 [Rhizopus arrhizus]
MRRQLAVVDKKLGDGRIPGQDVETGVAHVGRDRLHRLHQLAQAVGHALVGRLQWHAVTGQRKGIGALVVAHAQHLRQALQHLGRGAHFAALLDPGVPGDADAAQLGDFFAPQPRRAAAHA